MADAGAVDQPPERGGRRSHRRHRGRRGRRDRLAVAGAAILAVLAVMALAGTWLAPHDPIATDTPNRFAPSSWEHPLGTDDLGRDVLSRIVVGARLSLGSAVAVTAGILAIGLVVGTLCGFYQGPLDSVLMRVADALLAFPALLLALAIVGMLGAGLSSVLIGLVAVGWASYARIVRASVLAVRENEYVVAARASGASDWRVLWRHVLPAVVSPVLVLATLEMGELVLALAGLSFLGLGAQPPTAEWGAMLNDGRRYFLTEPQLMIWPGVAITLAVLGLNLVGDGLRDRLDPRVSPRVRRADRSRVGARAGMGDHGVAAPGGRSPRVD